ncbi:hypothetical protein FRC18_006833 [Serendipita sp. 400]|nr:hypothetical protein FRC18_006833 [Serendipita sp. 400]
MTIFMSLFRFRRLIPQQIDGASTGADKQGDRHLAPGKLQPILSLPTELLREIFARFVNNFDGNPFALLLVCKRWKAIAASMEALWTNIGLLLSVPMSKSAMSNFDFERGSMVLCGGPNDLMKAIRKVNNVGFTFQYVVPHHTVTVRHLNRGINDADMQWRSFDRVLFARHCKSALLDSELLNHNGQQIGLYEDYPRLESLNLSGVLSDSVINLLQSLETRAPNLRYITMDVESTKSLLTLHSVFARLHTLDLLSSRPRDDHLVLLVQQLKSVKTLRLRGNGRAIRLSPPSSSRLHELSLTNLPLSSFPDTIHSHLTRLELMDNPVPAISVVKVPITMPSLQVLSIDGSWSEIGLIEAPQLVSLTLRGPLDERQIWRHLLRQSSLRPRSLTIDETMSEFDLEFQFKGNWSQVCNLSVLCRGQASRFISTLGKLLKSRISKGNGGPDSEEERTTFFLCPQLQCITVQLDEGVLFHSDLTVRREYLAYPSLQQGQDILMEIIQARREEWPLLSVCLGYMDIQQLRSARRDLVWRELVV